VVCWPVRLRRTLPQFAEWSVFSVYPNRSGHALPPFLVVFARITWTSDICNCENARPNQANFFDDILATFGSTEGQQNISPDFAQKRSL
jgi:hypothetical protein